MKNTLYGIVQLNKKNIIEDSKSYNIYILTFWRLPLILKERKGFYNMKCNEQIEVYFANTKLVQICNVLYRFIYIYGMFRLIDVSILSKPYTKAELEKLV